MRLKEHRKGNFSVWIYSGGHKKGSDIGNPAADLGPVRSWRGGGRRWGQSEAGGVKLPGMPNEFLTRR